MSTRNRVPRRAIPAIARSTSPKNPIHPDEGRAPEPADPARVGDRLRNAIQIARRLQRSLKKGDEDALAKSTLLQGVLSGDVVAASIHARQRLQRENLQLRRRLTLARLKTEHAKRLLIEAETARSMKGTEFTQATIDEIKAIYGLAPSLRKSLPAPPADAEVTVLEPPEPA